MHLIVREYVLPNGVSPFRRWLDGLGLTIKARVQARILRFETGNPGDVRSLGGGLFEARIDFGAGYRVYFSKLGREVVLLLLGGDKASQPEDIRRARGFLRDYLRDKRRGEAS